MQMISFIFFGLVAVIFILLISINKIFKDDRKAIKNHQCRSAYCQLYFCRLCRLEVCVSFSRAHFIDVVLCKKKEHRKVRNYYSSINACIF